VEFSDVLNKFKDKNLFRIDLRHILKKIDCFEFSLELTELAELILDLIFKKIITGLAVEKNENDIPDWCVFGLGKLGGKELGYASDIELMFIYDEVSDSNNGNNTAESQFFFESVMQTFLKMIKAKREGIFEVDLNLRPYGQKGRLSVSFNSFKEYFSSSGHAKLFERQALTKMRLITGSSNSPTLSDKIFEVRDNFVYKNNLNSLDELYSVRKMQIENYVKDSKLFNIKYSSGGLVEIEYIAQILSIIHGENLPNLRSYSTVQIMNALKDYSIIDDKTFDILYCAFLYYLNFINILRMVKGNSKDLTVDRENPVDINYLIKRAKFIGLITKESEEELFSLLHYYRERVNNIFINLEIAAGEDKVINSGLE